VPLSKICDYFSACETAADFREKAAQSALPIRRKAARDRRSD